MRGTAKPLPPPLYAQRGTGARIRPGGVQKIRYGLPGVSRKLGTVVPSFYTFRRVGGLITNPKHPPCVARYGSELQNDAFYESRR